MGGRDHAGPGPRLIQGAGVLTIAAGLLRRDHMLLTSGSVSWHNHAHDVVSVVLYVDLVLAQLLLARRFGQGHRRPGWRAWRAWLMASAGVTAALLIAFAADTSAPSAGILQRAAVTIPLAVIAAMAVRLVKTPGTGG
jgi:peptidoglycan/LPS O-acetylase OafA/YrhL